MHDHLNIRLFQAVSFLQIESTSFLQIESTSFLQIESTVSWQDWFQATMLYLLETHCMHLTFCILEIRALAPGSCSVTVPETKCLKPGLQVWLKLSQTFICINTLAILFQLFFLPTPPMKI